MFYTVFFNSKDELPQDFQTYTEAKEYAEEVKEEIGIDYIIESQDEGFII